MRTKCAFTLIELLAVVAIIAVLATVLFATFGRMRESGESAECVSNLRGLHAAAILWIQDHKGTMPDARAWSYNNGKTSTLYPYQFAPYLEVNLERNYDWSSTKSPFKCERASASASSSNWFGRTYSINGYATASIAESGSGLSSRNPAYGYATQLMQIRDPSKMSFFMDGMKSGSGYRANVHPNHLTGGTIQPSEFVHNDSINVIFVDGHVDRVTWDDMQNVYNSSLHPFWRNNL